MNKIGTGIACGFITRVARWHQYQQDAWFSRNGFTFYSYQWYKIILPH